MTAHIFCLFLGRLMLPTLPPLYGIDVVFERPLCRDFQVGLSWFCFLFTCNRLFSRIRIYLCLLVDIAFSPRLFPPILARQPFPVQLPASETFSASLDNKKTTPIPMLSIRAS